MYRKFVIYTYRVGKKKENPQLLYTFGNMNDKQTDNISYVFAYLKIISAKKEIIVNLVTYIVTLFDISE